MGKKKIKKDKKLLPRHEVFVRALASGKDRADAYIEAYPKSAQSPRERVSRTAYQLLQRPEVMAAYEAELERHRREEAERNRWTYERSVEARMSALAAIQEERERRRSAQATMALSMMEHPPDTLSPEQVLLEAQRILMQPILTSQTTSAVAQLCDGLDRLTGLTKDDGGNQVNLFVHTDPWDEGD